MQVTLSRIDESPRIKTSQNKTQKPRKIRVRSFWLYAVQRHRYLGGFVAIAGSRCNKFNAVLLYPQAFTQQTLETQPKKIPNFNVAIIKAIEKSLNCIMIAEGEVIDLAGHRALRAGCDGTFTPVDLLDYIYAVLHSPTYREKYKEFLKIDFPRVPYPTGLSTFKRLTTLGSQLRQIHLLSAPVVNKPITQYPVDGDNVVVKPAFVIAILRSSVQAAEESADKKTNAQITGNVFINDTQYFANVPQTAWQFYIGGYQPAQKWLKDRKGRKLEFEDILHYQKIIVALTETDRLMKEIDKIEIP